MSVGPYIYLYQMYMSFFVQIHQSSGHCSYTVVRLLTESTVMQQLFFPYRNVMRSLCFIWAI